MTFSKTALAAALAAPCLAAPALAQDAAPPRADTTFAVGEIIVTARPMAGSTGNVFTSVDLLGGDVAQAALVGNAYELIGRMPGVQVTQFNQGTTSGKFSLRGFNGEGNINAVKLLIDGIPANSNSGNMPFIDMVFPLDIATIEVVRGTSDARHGLHAIAGSANILTRRGGDYAEARGSLNSYGTYEGQLAAGFDSGAFTQNYAAAWRDGEGYRDHADVERLSLSGRWGLALGDAVRAGAIARYYEGEGEEPGYLTLADRTTDPRMTNPYNASDADSRDMQQYALTLDAALGGGLDWVSIAYLNRLRDDRHVKFSASASQQRRLEAEDQYGLISTLHWHGELSGMVLMLEAGGEVQWQDVQSDRWLAVNRVPSSQTRSQRYDLTVSGAYVQAIIEPAEWLRITPAWRIDRVGGSFANLLAGSTAPVNDYGSIDQPKLAVAVMPLAGLTLYGNWGRTYQIGLGSGAYLIPPRLVDLAPSINTGWEAGVRYELGGLAQARLAYWEQSATGEIARRLNDPLGDFENVGATDRRGLDAQLALEPADGLSIWGALSWQEAVIAVPAPAAPAQAGKTIDHTPEWLWSGGISWEALPGLDLALSGRGASAYYLTNNNAEGRWGAMTLLDASLTYALNRQVELGLTVKNLLGDDHEYVWWDGAQSLHSPGDGSNATLSVRLRY